MGIEERVAALEKENQELREENEKLMAVVAQMKVTLNRLLDHYILESK